MRTVRENVRACRKYSEAELGKVHVGNDKSSLSMVVALECVSVLCGIFFPTCLQDDPVLYCCITDYQKT